MNTEKQAQQLELAAAILRTGHPFEFSEDHFHWFKTASDPLHHIKRDDEIRIVLAEPPYPAKIHNPDNLTAEQVGVGWRLLVKGEEVPQKARTWNEGKWGTIRWDHWPQAFENVTYSTQLSTPWPEAPKPDPYAELKAAHAVGKTIQYFNIWGDWQNWTSDLDFCDIDLRNLRIKPETIPLGLEDVPPMSMFRFKEHKDGTYYMPTCVSDPLDGIYFTDSSNFHHSYEYLKEHAEINRSLSTGKWNPDAWEPCSKTAATEQP